MSEQDERGVSDKGIGEGNLSRERGAPPYADKAYADELEPGATGQGGGTGGGAGGANVSSQGGGTGSSKQGGNTGSTTNSSG